jgi:hypothetical protein
MAIRSLASPAATTHYLYDLDGRLLAEAADSGATLREYVWLDDMPLAVVADVNTASPSLYFVHADRLNRPIKMTDGSQGVVWDAIYRPFGEAYFITGSATDNLRFPGQYFLLESASPIIGIATTTRRLAATSSLIRLCLSATRRVCKHFRKSRFRAPATPPFWKMRFATFLWSCRTRFLRLPPLRQRPPLLQCRSCRPNSRTARVCMPTPNPAQQRELIRRACKCCRHHLHPFRGVPHNADPRIRLTACLSMCVVRTSAGTSSCGMEKGAQIASTSACSMDSGPSHTARSNWH